MKAENISYHPNHGLSKHLIVQPVRFVSTSTSRTMTPLTRDALRQLQKHYRPLTNQEVPPTLSEIRIDSLLVHGDGLVLETAGDHESSPDRANQSTCPNNTLSTLPNESLEVEENRPIMEHTQDQTENLMTLHNTLQVNPDMAARLNHLISDQDRVTEGVGLSRIFDPNNRSLLLLDKTVPLDAPRKLQENKRRSALQSIQESDMNSPRLSSKLLTTTAQKSRIPRPQSFNIPGTLKTSKSKVDLKFPKLDM